MASILVIDDDEQFKTVVVQMLIADGHTVTTAPNGVEGANLYRADPTDLIITDMLMPKGSGMTTIRVLREQYPNVKVIAMSGAGRHRLDFARELGATLSLHKPFTPLQLADAVAQALGTSGPAPAKAPETKP